MAIKQPIFCGTRPDLKTIDDMEREALTQADGSCSKRIRNYWLEVTVAEARRFRYQYGVNFMSRADAIRVIKTA